MRSEIVELVFTMSSSRVASAEKLPFTDGEFTHAFSMESLYYYADMSAALSEIKRVLKPGGLFVTVVDLVSGEPAITSVDRSVESPGSSLE